MAQRIIFDTLATLTYEELMEAILIAAKKKNKKLQYKEGLHVHFRWGEPMDNIFATIDIIKEIQEFDDEDTDMDL